MASSSPEIAAVLDLTRGRYRARLATTPEDLRRAQRLRARCFGLAQDLDTDRFDHRCVHVVIENVLNGHLVGCFRMLSVSGAQIADCYSAQFYDLAALSRFEGPMVEIGRFCMDAGGADSDLLRLAWGTMARYVDAHGIGLLFGCSSFPGTRADVYSEAFALLRARHLAPLNWRPGMQAPEVVPFGRLPVEKPDVRDALQAMPSLLRTYLAMGGWVSDHAVVDRQMNTLHVFTAVDVAAIPEARKRALRLVAG